MVILLTKTGVCGVYAHVHVYAGLGVSGWSSFEGGRLNLGMFLIYKSFLFLILKKTNFCYFKREKVFGGSGLPELQIQ